MNTEQRDRIMALITERLLTLLEQEAPSAKLLETGMKWLEKVEKGDIESPELKKEKAEKLEQNLSRADLPFPRTEAPVQDTTSSNTREPRCYDRSLGS